MWGSYLHPLVCCTQHFFPHPSLPWSVLPFLNYADPEVPPAWLRSQLGPATSGTEQLRPLLTEPPACTRTCTPGTTLQETLVLLVKRLKKRAGYRQAQSAQPLSLGAEFRKEALLLTKGPHLWLTQVSSSQVIPRWLPPSATPLPSTHGFASWVVSPSSNTWAC